MDEVRHQRASRRIVLLAAAFALVATVAFSGGVIVGGSSATAAAVVSHIPFTGDNLNATPDSSVDLSDFWKAWNVLNSDYVITHASSTLPTDQQKIFGAIQGLAAAYGDPYTVFFPPKQAKAFSQNIAGNFGGVGIEIDEKDGNLVVVAPLKGTPAEAAGVKAGDIIAAIDGTPTDGMPIDKAVTLIRGKIGTSITLTVVRDGKDKDIKITRATIQVPETADGLDKASGVYYIALYEFTSNSAQLFDQAWQRFKASGAAKLIIDLRGNPGGYLDAAVHIASHFLPKGDTVVTEDFGGKQPNNVHTSLGYDDVPKDTKVAVLVDGGSASASEILTGALKDHHAATVIGTQTFGKGSVQTLFNLDGGSLKVTIARWVTPDGTWIMGNGITPDIIATSTPGAIQDKPGKDPQFDRAIRFLTSGQ